MYDMKLIIQIPCHNEAKTIIQTLADLPRKIAGINSIEYLVIDDGSSDNTAKIAQEHGAHHVIRTETNCGLAQTFQTGLDYSIKHGADIVVNTDGDNQYRGHDIEKLVTPILDKTADLVIGNRPIINHKEFSSIKKLLQIIGSWTINKLAKIKIKDATSGFRAYSRETCLKLNLYTKFSHCAETLIWAGNEGLRIKSVDIRVNPKTRDSRLFKNIPQYLYKQGMTIFWMFILYRPGAFFFLLGSIFMSIGIILGVRFLWLVYIFHDNVLQNRSYIPSLILLAICIQAGLSLYGLGILGKIIKFHRHISEKTLYTIKKNEHPN
jgi:glycosyltransferase involved in cell wall biosynthesis